MISSFSFVSYVDSEMGCELTGGFVFTPPSVPGTAVDSGSGSVSGEAVDGFVSSACVTVKEGTLSVASVSAAVDSCVPEPDGGVVTCESSEILICEQELRQDIESAAAISAQIILVRAFFACILKKHSF